MRRKLLLLVAALGLVACGRSMRESAMQSDASNSVVASMPTLDAEQRRRIDAIVSVFENDTTELQYGYVEILDDGRGITAGRAGFTTATGDLLEVVDLYAREVPNAPIAAYLPRLRVLAKHGSRDLAGLDGFETAWREAAKDPRFRAAQDQVVDVEVYQPTLREADALGISSALGLLVIYDAETQHGPGDDPDGVPAIAKRATARAKGTPRQGVDERAYLRAFLEERRAVLADAHDESTRAAWREATPRVDALKQIVDAGDLSLRGAIELAPYGTKHVIP